MMVRLLMIIFVTLTTLGSQLLLKHAVLAISQRDTVPKGAVWLIEMLCSPAVLAAVALQAVGFTAWMFVVSKVKLGVAFSIQGAFFYTLLALISWWFYGERLCFWQWVGIALVSSGVLLISLGGGRVT